MLCIVLDEFDYLFEGHASQGGIPGFSRLLAALRGIAQETGRLSLVFIGRDPTHLNQPMLEGAPNPMLGWFVPLYLGPLEPSEADDLLVTLSARAGDPFEPAACELARVWTGGHPSLLRQFGSSLMEIYREKSSPKRDEGAIVRRPDFVCIRTELLERYQDRDLVGHIHQEVRDLFRARYPDSYRLLCALGGSDGLERTLQGHGGWRGEAAQRLRRFGLLQGTKEAPTVPEGLREYLRENLPTTFGETADV